MLRTQRFLADGERARVERLGRGVEAVGLRGTGITAYLMNGGTLEKARQMVAQASTRTTKLYDPREDHVARDKVVKINSWDEQMGHM
jgi:hypothetical protein